jgi:hypothetical protein
MLHHLWLYKKGETKATTESNTCIKNFLSNLNYSIHDETFTGSPLYIRMIATVHKMDVEMNLNSGNWGRRNNELLNFYETCVEKTLLIYLTNKKKADISISSVLDDHEEKTELYLKNIEKCALVAILPLSMLKSLHDKKIEDKTQTFLDKVQTGKDKTGIVMNVVNGKPQFVHRTFEEYFTARWFSRNFESNRSVMEHILFDREFTFVRDMFDRMLARSSPLHCAVLELDTERFEILLDETCDISAVDEGGRTVMHIIASRNYTFLDNINRVTQYKASLDKPDCVLQWTPLQYAVKSENWFIVERLLASNFDRSGMDMILQRAKDPDYLDLIIIQAKMYDYLSLLEFLNSNDLNIHLASYGGFLNPLHAAIQVKQLQPIWWLNEHGVDCNTPYSDGKTPLFDVVTEGSLDVVQIPVKEGVVSTSKRDDYGRTVIDEAKLSSTFASCEDDIENRKTIVKNREMVHQKKRRRICIII